MNVPTVGECLEALQADRDAGDSFIDAAQARINLLDSRTNSVVIQFEDPTTVRGLQGRRFSGVPFLLKDALCGVRGERRTEGSRWLKETGYRDDYDSVVVQRLRHAGFGLLGRTNVPEFASSDTTEPLAWGPTLNPADPTRSAGGSSGGAAAAVAMGYVPVAHGTDASGSIRVPASWCGVVGYKPSRGLVPNSPDFGDTWGAVGFRSTHGLLARTVRDVALVLPVIAGGTPGGLATLDAAVLRRAPSERSLRIGVVDDDFADSSVRSALRHLADLFEELGHQLAPAALPGPAAVERSSWVETVPGTSMALLVDWWTGRLGRAPTAHELEPANWEMWQAGIGRSSRAALETLAWMEAASTAISGWERHFDLLLTPTTARGAPLLGNGGAPGLDELMTRIAHTTRFTDPFSLSGQPCISLPVASDDAGLPCGLQIIAHRGADVLLLGLAAEAEACGIFRPTPPESAGAEERR